MPGWYDHRSDFCREIGAPALKDVPEYGVWVNMRRRCRAPHRKHYEWYGSRGIKVCDRWQSFPNFYQDMGPRPSPKHSIERINNSRGYEPDNCRWATPIEQHNNKRNNTYVIFRGQQLTVPQACRLAGIVSANTVHARLKRGWSAEQAITMPSGARTRWGLRAAPSVDSIAPRGDEAGLTAALEGAAANLPKNGRHLA